MTCHFTPGVLLKTINPMFFTMVFISQHFSKAFEKQNVFAICIMGPNGAGYDMHRMMQTLMCGRYKHADTFLWFFTTAVAAVSVAT